MVGWLDGMARFAKLFGMTTEMDRKWGFHGDLPSGKHTKNYLNWPFIADLPIKNGDFP